MYGTWFHGNSPCCCVMRRTFQIPVGLPKSTAKNELCSAQVQLRVYMLPSIALGAGLPIFLELCQHVWWSAISPGGASESIPVGTACIKFLQATQSNMCDILFPVRYICVTKWINGANCSVCRKLVPAKISYSNCSDLLLRWSILV